MPGFPCVRFFDSTFLRERRRARIFQLRCRLFPDILAFLRFRGFSTDVIRIHFTPIGPIRNASITARRFFGGTRPRPQFLLILGSRIRVMRNHGLQVADHLIQHLIDPVGQLDGMLVRRVRVPNRLCHVPGSIHDLLKVVLNRRVIRSLSKPEQQLVQDHLPGRHAME